MPSRRTRRRPASSSRDGGGILGRVGGKSEQGCAERAGVAASRRGLRRPDAATTGIGRGSLARALGRGRPRGGRGRQRDPGAGGARRRQRRAGLRARRGGPRGARRSDPARDRAGVPAGARPGAGPARRGPGRGGPRASPGVRTSPDRRARDPARPRVGLGRGVEVVLPGHAGRPPDRHPPDLAAASARSGRRRHRPRPGDGLRDRPPPDDAAVPRGPRAPRATTASGSLGAPRPRRRLRLRHPRRSRRSGSARRRSSASTPTRSRSRRRVANARRNGVGRRMRARQGSLPSGEPPFDIVVANLIASAARRPRAGARARARVPAGRLVASGHLHRPRDRGARRRSRRQGSRSASGPSRGSGSRSWRRPTGRRGLGLTIGGHGLSSPADRSVGRCPSSRSCSSRTSRSRSRCSCRASILLRSRFARRDATRERQPLRPGARLVRDARVRRHRHRACHHRHRAGRHPRAGDPRAAVAARRRSPIYAIILALAFFIQRPELQRLLRCGAAIGRRAEGLARTAPGASATLAYVMAAAVGLIAFLMSTKPALW